MDFTPLILIICIFSCSELDCVHGDFLVMPKNAYFVVGTGDNSTLPTLNCRTDGSIVWSVRDAPLSHNSVVSKLFRDRFEITGNNNANEYNLKFKKIDLSDADRYRCTDFDSSDSASAQVLVVDGLPTCSANANLTDLLEGETFTVSCEMTYSAAWDPTMKWTDNRNNEITANEGGEDGSRRKTTITIQAQNGDTKSFRCLMQFGFPPAGVIPPNEGGNTFSRHDPGYRETYQTDVMNVWVSPRDITISPDWRNYIPGDEVVCSARGNPAPMIEWVNLEVNDTHNGRPGILTITKEMEGNRMYRCIATSQIRGVPYETSAYINFTVTIPTTTTTLATTSVSTTEGETTAAPVGGLGPGETAGIVIGVILALILLIIIIFCLIRRSKSAPSKEKEKQKPRLDGVDQVRHPNMNGPPGKPPHVYSQKPPLDDDFKSQPSPNDYDKAKWGEQLEPQMYDVALDDTPRSRKPIQVYDAPDYTDFRRV